MPSRWQNDYTMNFVGTVHNMTLCDWTGYQKGSGFVGGDGDGEGGRLALLRLLTSQRAACYEKFSLIQITISNVFENSCSVVYPDFSSAHVVFDSLAKQCSQIPVPCIVAKNHGDT